MIERHHPEAVADLIREGYRPSLIAHYLNQRHIASYDDIAQMLGVNFISAVALVRGGSNTMRIGNPKDVETYNRLEMRFASLVCRYTVGK